MTDADLLRAAIRAHGGSKSAFARDVLRVDPANLRRWLRGDHQIRSTRVKRKLDRFLAGVTIPARPGPPRV